MAEFLRTVSREILAQWRDSQYRFDLIRSSYGPTFRLVGLMKRLEPPARARHSGKRSGSTIRKRRKGMPPV